MAYWSPFERAISEKMNTLNNLNNTIEMKYAIIKEVWSMLLTDEGKRYLTRNDNLRNVTKCKVLELMGQPSARNKVQFMSQSRYLLTVIENINLGKQIG